MFLGDLGKLVTETYTTGLAHFLEYLNAGMDVHDFSYMLEEFFNDEGIDPPDSFDPDEPYEILTTPEFEEMKEDFIEWLKKNVKANSPELPTYIFMENGKIMPRQTWLVHFSPNARDIAANGFRFGGEDFRELGLTTHFAEKHRKKAPGWNFAYDAIAEKMKIGSYAYGEQYGKDFVVFQSAGIKAFHNTDYENQVVFWGPGVKERYLVVGDHRNKEWKVMSGSRAIYTANDPEKAVQWIMKNHNQYRRTLNSSQPISPTPKKDREALLAKQPEPVIKSMTESEKPKWGTSGGSFITPEHKKAKKSYKIFKSIPTDPPQAVQVAQGIGEDQQLFQNWEIPIPTTKAKDSNKPVDAKKKITPISQTYQDVVDMSLVLPSKLLRVEKPVWVSILKLKETEKNNQTKEGQQKAWEIAQAIRKSGKVEAVLATPDGNLYDGHHRLEAFRKLGLGDIPVQYLELNKI